MFGDYKFSIRCSQNDLDQLATKITHNDIKKFFRSLGLDSKSVQDVERTYDRNTIHNVLVNWRKKEGAQATKERIIGSLHRINRIDIAKEIFSRCWSEPEERLEMVKNRIMRRLREINITIKLPQVSWMEKIHPVDELFVDLEMFNVVENFGLRTEEPMELDDLFADVDGRKPLRILVEGGPGTGKSSLVLKLLDDWRKRKEYIASKFKMVFLFEMRYYRSTDTIDEIFMKECELPGLTGEETIKCLKTYEHEIVLLMDGYDELKEECKQTVLPMIQMKDYPSMVVLVTSRTGMLDFETKNKNVYNKIPSWDKRVVLKRVQQHHFYNFYKIYLESEFCNWEKTVISFTTGRFREVFENPLFLMLLGVLLEDKAIKNTSSFTSIYKEFLKFAVRRSLIRDRVIDSEMNWDLFSKDAKTSLDGLQLRWFVEFGLLAMKKLCENNLIFTEEEILNSCGGDNFVLKLGLLTKIVNIHRHNKQNFYQSIHKSLLEFVAAFALSNLFETKPEEFKKKLRKVSAKLRPFQDYLFYNFLAGLLNGNAYILIEFLHQFGYKLQDPYIMNIFLEIEDVNSFYLSFEPFLKSYIPPRYSISDINRHYFQSQLHSRILEYALKHNLIKTLEWDTNVFINLPVDITIENLELVFRNGEISEDFIKYKRKTITCRNLECKVSQGFKLLKNWSDFTFCIESIETQKTVFRIIPPFGIHSNVISYLWKELHAGRWKRKKDKSIIYSSVASNEI